MSTSKVILVSIITSAITSAALFFGLERLGGGPLLDAKSEVPSVVGLRPDQARMLLESRRLLLALSGEETSSAVPRGQIARQVPLGGSLVREGSTINVTLSRGSDALKVPALAGLTLTQAMHQLTGAGLQVGVVTKQAHQAVAEGEVISSIPPAGDTAARGAAVNLQLSTGEERVEVPKVTGRGLTRAKEELERAGLTAGRVTHGFDEDRPPNIVLRQDPAAESTAPKGSAVDLVLNDTD